MLKSLSCNVLDVNTHKKYIISLIINEIDIYLEQFKNMAKSPSISFKTRKLCQYIH